MLCPNCSTSLALTWARYFKSITRKHSCPTCGAVGRVRFGWRNWALLGFLALALGTASGFLAGRLVRFPLPSFGEVLLAALLPFVLLPPVFFVLDRRIQDRARLAPDEGSAELRRTLRELAIGLGLGVVVGFLGLFVFGQCVSRWADATQASYATERDGRRVADAARLMEREFAPLTATR